MTIYEYPQAEACRSIFNKLEMDFGLLNLECQDWQYTLADDKFLENYLELYQRDDTTDFEKRVLGCFIIQSLEDILIRGKEQYDINRILKMLSKDMEIHQTEFEYWGLLDDKHYLENIKDCWKITKYIRNFASEK